MIREVFITVIVLSAKLHAEAKTCNECTTTYETAKGAASPDKCSALKDYLTCLETASGAGCPLTTEKATAINSDYTDISASCTLTALCTCQKDYWGTDMTGGDTVKCDTAKKRAKCLKGETDEACDGSSKAVDVGTTTVAILKGLTTCGSASTCACEVIHFIDDVSTPAQKCTVNKNFISCLVGKTEVGCGSNSIVKDLATTAESQMGENCDKSAVCSCEIDYTKADQSTNTEKCTSANTFLSCLDEINTADEKGCNGTVTAASLKAYVESKIQTVFCSSAGFQAEISFTIVCLLLTASAIFST